MLLAMTPLVRHCVSLSLRAKRGNLVFGQDWSASMKKGTILFVVVTALILVNSFFTAPDKIHFIWEKFTLFSALFGFIGCLLLIAVTKLLVKHFIQRNEGYYD
jgi:hypothetical protein